MLKHFPRSGMDFLLQIFYFSWSSHSFPSFCKISSNIPINKMKKPLDSPASFQPISLTTCVSKLLERIILSRLLFFLEPNSILSSGQAGFYPGQSTLDQILFLSQSILDGFNKPRPGSLTILCTIDFSKAFDSVWHPALFYKLIPAGLPPCFARWTQAFLSDRRACVVFQDYKRRFFRVNRGVPQGSVLGPVLFSLFINGLPASLPSSVSCSLYADDLAIRSFSPSVSTAVWATQAALFRLERWSEYWCLPLNPNKCELPSSQCISTNLASIPTSSYSAPASVSIQLQSLLGSPSTALFPFFKHVSSLKAKFFPRLKAFRCISASSWGPSKESFSLQYKGFSSAPSHVCFTRMVSFPKRYQFHQIGMPPPSGQSNHHRLPLVLPYPHFFSLRLLILPYESLWPISLFHLMSGLFVSQPPFPFQVWADVK